jgi:hypothetical protein
MFEENEEGECNGMKGDKTGRKNISNIEFCT